MELLRMLLAHSFKMLKPRMTVVEFKAKLIGT
jgi:hypothetical protein